MSSSTAGSIDSTGTPHGDLGDQSDSETTGLSPRSRDVMPEYSIAEHDRLSALKFTFALMSAAVGGAFVAFVGWFVLSRTHLPSFNSSYLTRAVTSACAVVLVTIVAAVLYYWVKNRPRHPEAKPRTPLMNAISYAVLYLAPAALVTIVLGIALAGSKLYLDGISVDQGFRTQILSRMTAELSLADVAYEGLPSYYPLGWFWLGGRFANLLGLSGWVAFQPWSIISLAAASSLLVPVWQRLTGSLPLAAAIALTTTSIMLTTNAEEPYAAIVAMGMPAAAIIGARGLAGNRFAMGGIAVYLGVSATFYTLYTGVAALTVVLTAVAVAFTTHSIKPFFRLAAIGTGSLVIAASVWTPFVIKVLSGAPTSNAGGATHFLPEGGSQVPLPMLSFSVLGMLCLLGLLHLLMRTTDWDIRALATALLVQYIWVVASMISTLGGSTLLGFRLASPITMTLATAGVGAAAALHYVDFQKLWPDIVPQSVVKPINAALLVVLCVAGLGYVQTIPTRIAPAIELAYTDSDGNGERADKWPADASVNYAKINEVIAASGHKVTDTIVLTDEFNFVAYNPYRTYQAFTSHYANPLGEYDARNLEIKSWAHLNTADELVQSMDKAPWRGPDVLILRGQLDKPDEPLVLDLGVDIHPNYPNVRFERVLLQQTLFQKHWEATQVGPFVVLIRK